MKPALLALVTAVVVASQPTAGLLPEERALLDRLDVDRTLATIRHLSEGIVRNNSGAGAGSAIAGSADEKALADYIEQQLRSLGLATRQEPLPVRHYEYGSVTLTAAGKPIDAVSLHAAGGTWGTRDGVPRARKRRARSTPRACLARRRGRRLRS
jgi:hypothetical protein